MSKKQKRAAPRARRAAPAEPEARRPPAVEEKTADTWKRAAARRARPERERIIKDPRKRIIKDPEVTYYLTGESILSAVTVPYPPTAGGPTTIRVTHNNSYGPCRGDVFVRVGDPETPLGIEDFDTVSDWTPAVLIEEVVWDDRAGDWVAAPRRVVGDTTWQATYEAELRFRRGRHRIEIKFVSPEPDVVCSIVASNWEVRVR